MKSKSIFFKIAFSAFLLIWLLKTGRLNLEALSASGASASHLMGMAIVAACLVGQIFRWWILLKAQGLSVSFGRALWLSWVGYFLSLPLPGMAGGALARAYLVAKDVAAAGRMGAISAVILDRIIGLLALVFLGIAALSMAVTETGWDSRLTPVWLSTSALIAVFALLAAMARIGFTRRWLLSLIPVAYRAPVVETFSTYQKRGPVLLAAFLLSLLTGMLTMVAFVIGGRAIGETVSLVQACQVVPLVFVAGTLPIAPDGIGVSETTAALLFSRYGVASGAGIMLIYRIWLLLLRLPGGLIFLFHKAHAK